MKWPQDLWVVWCAGMRPWACLNEQAARENAAFCIKNGHWDLEIQKYTYNPGYKTEKFAGTKKALTPEAPNATKAEPKTQKAPPKGATKKGRK